MPFLAILLAFRTWILLQCWESILSLETVGGRRRPSYVLVPYYAVRVPNTHVGGWPLYRLTQTIGHVLSVCLTANDFIPQKLASQSQRPPTTK